MKTKTDTGGGGVQEAVPVAPQPCEGNSDAGMIQETVPTFSLRADNPFHYKILTLGLDHLIACVGHEAPAVEEMLGVLRTWEDHWRPKGGFVHSKALAGTVHFI